MGIIKSQAQILAKKEVQAIIESGNVPDDFPISSFRKSNF